MTTTPPRGGASSVGPVKRVRRDALWAAARLAWFRPEVWQAVGQLHWLAGRRRKALQWFGRGLDEVLTNDPRFEEKLIDVVGLYLNPPERAAVFCFDEKTQVQALDRTQPSLPMKPGRAGTMTHD